MHRLFFRLRLVSGMILSGLRATPDKLGHRDLSMNKILGLGLLGILGGILLWTSDSLLGAVVAAAMLLTGFFVFVRRRGAVISWRSQIRGARDAQFHHMYPTQHVRMEAAHAAYPDTTDLCAYLPHPGFS